MKYPDFLKEKGTIGIVAPSFGISGSPYRIKYDQAITMWNERGHEVKSVPHIFDFLHSPEISVKELEDFYVSKDNEILISAAGGELMLETEALWHYDVLRNASPKWFIGYSDNTNFCFPLTTICDVASIYGMNITDFGTTTWDDAVNNTYKLLRGEKLKFYSYQKCQIVDMKYEKPLDGYNYDTDTKWKNIHGGNTIDMKGRLIGGCLDCLNDICGTPYDHMKEFAERYKEDGIVFYFEACNLDPFGVKRALWRMKECEWFTHIRGFLVGRPNNPEPAFDYTHEQIILDMLMEYQVPIITQFDTGHVPPAIPLINGSIAHVVSNDIEQYIEFELD